MFELETKGNRTQGNLRTCGIVYRNQYFIETQEPEELRNNKIYKLRN